MMTHDVPVSGGPIPKFTDYHIWKALMTLSETCPLGRKTMSNALSIGEGSTRTILDIFMNEGLIIVTKSGAILSDKGKKTKEIMRMDVVEIDCIDMTIGKVSCAVKVRGAAKKISYGCEERDNSIRAGALGATTLVCLDGKLSFPGSDYPVSKTIEMHLKKELKYGNGDAIIIGTAVTADIAEMGAVSAALTVMGGVKLGRPSSIGMSYGRNTNKELISLAFAIHDLVGGLPVCARNKDNLGIRMEGGAVIDNAYSGAVLEEAMLKGTTIRKIAESGPYKGIRVIVTPIELDNEVIAVIGVVDVRAMAGIDNLIRRLKTE